MEMSIFQICYYLVENNQKLMTSNVLNKHNKIDTGECLFLSSVEKNKYFDACEESKNRYRFLYV